MTRALVALGLAASVLVLAGCGAAPPLPEPLTQEQVDEVMAEQASRWWTSMFPDEPQPTVEVVAHLPPESAGEQIMKCIRDANLEGVTLTANGGMMTTGFEAIGPLNRQQFICSQQYPYEPTEGQILSEEENEWLYNFNVTRLVPCLRLMGYRVNDSSAQFSADNRGSWVPYFDMKPIPTAAEWELIDRTCPPSPVGPDYSEYRPSRG